MPSIKMMYFALFCVAVAPFAYATDIVPVIPANNADGAALSIAIAATTTNCVDGLTLHGGLSLIIALVLKFKTNIGVWLVGALTSIKINVLIQIITIVVVYVAVVVSIAINGLDIANLLLIAFNNCKSGLNLIIAANVSLSAKIKVLIAICLEFKAKIKLLLGA